MSTKSFREKVHSYITKDSKISGGEPIISGKNVEYMQGFRSKKFINVAAKF